MTGAARLRADGDLDFAVLSGGLPTITEIYVRGRLNAPDFDSGSGTVLHDNPILLSVPDAVDFVAAPCPTFVGDIP